MDDYRQRVQPNKLASSVLAKNLGEIKRHSCFRLFPADGKPFEKDVLDL